LQRNILTAMNNLTRSYHALGRTKESAEMQAKVLRRIQGAEHPDTLTAMQNLVSSYNLPREPSVAE
jgi:hypothetical protein